MSPALAAALCLALAAPGVRPAARAARASQKRSALDKARETLLGVRHDPRKRRFRHWWERAIKELIAAAKGKDAPQAWLEAARARYSLYHLSAVDSDRADALTDAGRAARLGNAEAKTFAAAIRREMGADDEPGTAVARAPDKARKNAAPPSGDDAGDDADGDSDPTSDAAPADAGPAHVSEVKSWSGEGSTRVAVYLSHPAHFDSAEIAAEDGRPRRLALDIQPGLLDAAAEHVHAVGSGQVDRVRAAQYSPDTVRVVLDLASRDAWHVFSLDDPPRLIADVGQRSAEVASAPPPPAAAAPVAPAPQAPPPAPATAGDAAARPRVVRRIVIDAGHGGHDTGAIGPSRVREKDVVLRIANALAKKLRAAGFEVLLTRKDDTFVPLEERTAFANTHGADLFVSIHANANPHRKAAGIETYTLDVSDDRYARRLAARENGVTAPPAADGAGADVKRILTDLDATSSAASSLKLAALVQKDVCAGVRARIGEVRDLGVKSAVFYVLLGARMPAVLVETAFISNRGEEKRLASPAYRDEVAEGIARAIREYAGGDAKVAAAP